MRKRTGTYLNNRMLASLMLIAVLSISCQRQEEVMKHWSDRNNEISMSMDGNILMEYRPDTWQTGFSDRNFSAMHDELKSWFKVELDQSPVVGQRVDGLLTWKARSYKTEKRSRLTFETVKTDETGKIWLYNRSQRIGLVIGPMDD